MLGIQGVVLADPTPPGPVGPVDLPDRDAVGQQVAGQAVAEAARASTPAATGRPCWQAQASSRALPVSLATKLAVAR
jgi:hypothetical protein